MNEYSNVTTFVWALVCTYVHLLRINLNITAMLFKFCCAGPSALTVNIVKYITNSSIVVRWDAVDDSLPTGYEVSWTSRRSVVQAATVTEQTAYTITGLTLDTVYTLTVIASNMCGRGPEFRTSVSLSTDITSTTSSISPTVTTTTTNPMTATSTVNPNSITATTAGTDIITTMNNSIVATINSMTTIDSGNAGTTIKTTSVKTTTTSITSSTTTATTADESSKFSSTVNMIMNINRLKYICTYVRIMC